MPPPRLTVDPGSLRLPTTRLGGADPVKLNRQLARHGLGIAGMPPLLVVRGSDGELMIVDGVTRATRVAKYLPGTLVLVEVTDDVSAVLGHLPTVRDRLP
jgi:hypothetical protein